MMSRAAIFALVVSATVMIAGCSAPGDGRARLEMQTGLGATDPTLDVLRDIARGCEPEGATIELVPQTQTYEADMRTRMASRDLPDIWSTHGWSVHRYGDFLAPLQERAWAPSLAPSLEEVMTDDDGNLYALPIDADVAGIVYNRTVVEGLGIEVDRLTTWDAFRDALGQVDAAGIIPVSASSKDSWMAGNITDFMLSGAYSGDDLDGMRAGIFETDGYERVLTEVERWSSAGFINPDFSSATLDDIARALATGSTAFVFVQNYLVSTALEFDPGARLGYLPVPSFDGEPYLVGGEGTAYGVSASSENRDLALAFVDCLAESDNLARLAHSLGGVPGLEGVPVERGVLSESHERWASDGAYEVRPYFDRVYLPNGMWDTIVTTTSSVITGHSGVSDAVEQVERQFEALFGR